MDDSDWLTAGELAREFRVSERTVRRWARKGQIAARKLGPRIWRFSRTQLEVYLRQEKRGEGGSDG